MQRGVGRWVLGRNAGEDRERMIGGPAGALDALQQRDHLHTAAEVAELGEDVDAGLDDTDGLVEDAGLVADVVGYGQVDARHVRLQEEERFHVWVPHWKVVEGGGGEGEVLG